MATYYSNCAVIAVGCYLYSTTTLTTVPPGKYSNGVTCWTVGAAGLVTGQTNCPAASTTTTTIPPGCLVAGTMINMLDGSFKPVEEIVAGDSLLSIQSLANFYKDETFDLIETKVLSIATYTSKKIFTINNGLLVTSESHIHVAKRDGNWGIVKGFDLQIGDIFVDRYGNEVAVSSIDVEEKEQTVYNIDVDNQDVYFANNILTHNKPNYICCSDVLGGPCNWTNISAAPGTICSALGLFDCNSC